MADPIIIFYFLKFIAWFYFEFLKGPFYNCVQILDQIFVLFLSLLLFLLPIILVPIIFLIIFLIFFLVFVFAFNFVAICRVHFLEEFKHTWVFILLLF